MLKNIKKIHEGTLKNGPSKVVYPITYTEAVKDETEETLDSILRKVENGVYIIDKAIKERHLDVDIINTVNIKDNNVTLAKLDAILRGLLEAATGLPQDIIEAIQNVLIDIESLQKVVFPIVLEGGFTAPDVLDHYTFTFDVKRNGVKIIPDRVILTLRHNPTGEVITREVNPQAEEGIELHVCNNDSLTLQAFKDDLQSNIISADFYTIFVGHDSSSALSSETFNSCVRYNWDRKAPLRLRVTNEDNEYLWFLVPLGFNFEITADGMKVPIQYTGTTAYTGKDFIYNGYLSQLLTANTWDLTITEI